MEITDGQVELLNTLYKYTPPLHNWNIKGPSGLGDIIKGQQIAIDSIPGVSTPIVIGTGADGSNPYITIAADTSFSILLSVTEAFGVGATLTIGSASNHSLVVDINDFDITAIGNYVVNGQLFSVDTELFTYLNSNSSSTGLVTITRT